MNKERKKQRKNDGGFLSGVLILSFSTVLVKVIGLAYKIPMLAYLGAEGMGYFNSAYEIYALLCVFSTAGLPVALSMLIAARRERGEDALCAIRRIDRSAVRVFLLLGVCGTVLLTLLAKPISKGIGNEDAFFCILAIAPALLCVCFSSAVRGYFQGFGRMTPTAISQLIEALGKLIFGVWFAAIALKKGMALPKVAAFAVLGLTLGTLLSALYLFLLKAADPNRCAISSRSQPKERTLSTLLKIAVPITVSSAVLNLTRLIDMTLIMRRLQAIGMSAPSANEIYGSYTTLAVPVFGLIPSLITPISLALVPKLSAAIEGRNKDEEAVVADRSIRLTVLLAMPASFGIAVYARPILSLLFSGENEAISISAPLLSLLGVSILFSGLITTTNAILQSYRCTLRPILSMAIGALIKILTAYLLIGMPAVGIYGAPISTFLCNLTVTGLNFYFLRSCVSGGQRVSGFFQIWCKPLVASTFAILASLAVYLSVERMLGNETAAFLGAVATAVLVYGIFALLLRIVTKEDVALLPMGQRLLSRMERSRKSHRGTQMNIKE